MAEPYSFRPSKKASHRANLSSFDYQNQYAAAHEGYARESDRQHPKRQRLDGLGQDGGPNSSARPSAWTDQMSFLLLDVWGEMFLQQGRRSLRSDDWTEVAEKVAMKSGIEVSDVDCRQQLDKLKRKFRKIRTDSSGMANYGWKFYKKMEMLLGVEMDENELPLPCGVDSGEYCFADTRVYLDRSNAFDEMRDSPSESEEFDEEEEEEDDDLPPSRKLGGNGGEGMKVLVDSIERFGQLYERIESDKREQMLELRKMRADFERELELQKKEILEKAGTEIAKLRAGAYKEDYDGGNVENNVEDEEDDNREDDEGEDGDGCNGA